MPMDAAAEEDARRREEAELLHAIAMSLQIQEEAARLEQAAQLDVEPMRSAEDRLAEAEACFAEGLITEEDLAVKRAEILGPAS